MKIEDKRIDPSEVKQYFDEVQVTLHCCRYWKFSAWNFDDLSAPFWRFYYNEVPGAIVSFDGQEIVLHNKLFVMIPPNTSFSISTIFNHDASLRNIQGSRIESSLETSSLNERKMFDHLFIHFNLGLKYDSYLPGIYPVLVTDECLGHVAAIKKSLYNDHRNIPFQVLFYIHALLFSALNCLPNDRWSAFHYDQRVISTLNYIEKQLSEPLLNAFLAARVNLATNSFARLFRDNMGMSVQQYIQKRRLEKSLHMLHHTQAKIERIAIDCGFYDLHHFSRFFKKNMAVSPSEYKKQKTVG
jgi:AraC-like DNA-binding protein